MRLWLVLKSVVLRNVVESVVRVIANIVVRNKAIQYIGKYINRYTIYCVQ